MAEPVISGPGGAVRFGLLGPLQVVDAAGAARGVSAAKQRIVLAALLLSAGEVVPAGVMAEALWDDDPPPNAAAAMRTYVMRLRHALGPAGARVVGRPGGWAVQLDGPAELDLAEVEELWAAGRAAAGAGDWPRVSSLLGQALGMWRGQPLLDVPSAALSRREAGRLTELRCQLTEARIDADLRLGRPGELVPELQRLAAEQPLREHVWVQLMLACYRSGRQAASLQAYADARAILAGELGVEPGPELREMHRQVLAADPALAADLPNGVVVGERAGVFQLPAAPADFTGRVADCERIVGAVAADGGQPGVPAVAICGPPGIGKTTLALHIGHMLGDRFPDGQLWAELAGSSARPRAVGEVLGELLRALGMGGPAIPADDSERAACLRSRLAGSRVLVVVDDAATAAQVRLLMPGTAGCALVVTSRAALEGLDGALLVPLEVMTDQDAVGLLARIAGRARVEAEPDASAELVRACGALPLALRIAGAKLATRPSWPVSAMVRTITGAHDRLGELQAGELSVRASIASSYESLPDPSRRAFRLLALLGPSDFARWVAGALLGDPQTGAVGELTGRSLLTPVGVDATGEPRYRLHDLLRDYAAERLDQEEPPAAARQALERLLTAWLQLTQAADARLPPDPFFPPPARQPPVVVVPQQTAERLTADPRGWFTSERINLLAAIEHACQIGRLDLARLLASHQGAYQRLQDRHDDSLRIWRRIADYPGQPDDTAEAVSGRLRVAASMVGLGLAADALPLFDSCVQAAEETADSKTLTWALYWRSSCVWDLDEFEQAQRDAAWGIQAARQAGSSMAEVANLTSVSNALAALGFDDEAIAPGERALAIALSCGTPTHELIALHAMAFTCTMTGQHERAARLSMRRIELSQELGSPALEALGWGVLSDAYYGMGRYEEGADSLLRALPVFRDRGRSRYYAVCLMKLGQEYEAMGRYAEAIGYLDQSLPIFRRLCLPHKVEAAQAALDRCRNASTS